MRTTIVPYIARSSVPSNLFTEVDRLFESFANWPTPYERFSTEANFETAEGDDHFMVSFDLPGLKKDQLKIEVKDRTLTVSGERRGAALERRLRIPESVNLDAIEARYEDGVLDLYLPKRAESTPKQIEIKTGENKGIFAKLLSSKKEPEMGQLKQ
jgi:HSP20 family protein